MKIDPVWKKITEESEKFRAMFVNWSLAKRLKLLGFNESCFAYFRPDKDSFIYTVRYDNHNLLSTRVSAPLWSQIIDWLDSKGIYIDIDHEFGEDWEYYIDNGGNGHHGHEIIYKTRQEATIDAVTNAIKLIENGLVKSTNYRGVKN